MPTDTIETTPTVEEESAPGIDIDAASDKLGAELFPQTESETEKEPLIAAVQEHAEKVAAPPATVTTDTTLAQPVSSAPKSWPTEMHVHWEKVPPEVQAYWQTREKQMVEGMDHYKGIAQYGKAIQDAVAPFQETLRGQSLPQTLTMLLQAHKGLTDPNQKRAVYEQLGRDIGYTPAQPANGETPPAPPPLDPRITEIQAKYDQIQQTLARQQEAAYTAALAKASQEVEAFAADPAHPHFDACHDDIMARLKLGDDLPSAYEKAVWANAVTRQQELARVQTETEAKLRENARLEALPKQKARGVNVKGRDTQRTPTEALGSLDEELKAGLAAIKSRTTH